jgi:hypothetical protein
MTLRKVSISHSSFASGPRTGDIFRAGRSRAVIFSFFLAAIERKEAAGDVIKFGGEKCSTGSEGFEGAEEGAPGVEVVRYRIGGD